MRHTPDSENAKEFKTRKASIVQPSSENGGVVDTFHIVTRIHKFILLCSKPKQSWAGRFWLEV